MMLTFVCGWKFWFFGSRPKKYSGYLVVFICDASGNISSVSSLQFPPWNVREVSNYHLPEKYKKLFQHVILYPTPYICLVGNSCWWFCFCFWDFRLIYLVTCYTKAPSNQGLIIKDSIAIGRFNTSLEHLATVTIGWTKIPMAIWNLEGMRYHSNHSTPLKTNMEP